MAEKMVVTIGGRETEIEIVRSARRTIALHIKPGGRVLIRAPWHVSGRALREFAGEKSGWIEKHLVRMQSQASDSIPPSVSDGTRLPFMGSLLTVKMIQGFPRRVTRNGEELIFTLPELITGDPAGEITAMMADAWYLREAKAWLPTRTHRLAAQHPGLLPAPHEVRVRRMKSRWGSCSRNGNISLNSELMKRHTELIDYVIYHELCHLVHHNHGANFYALLERVVPQYRELRRKLREQPPGY